MGQKQMCCDTQHSFMPKQEIQENISRIKRQRSKVIEYKDVKIKIIKGNIWEQESEAMVILQDKNILFQGYINQQILLQGGKDLVDQVNEIKQKRHNRKQNYYPGQIISTYGGDLIQEYLLHINFPEITQQTEQKSLIVECIHNLLDFASQRLKLKSISMPIFQINEYSNIDTQINACMMLRGIQTYKDKQIKENNNKNNNNNDKNQNSLKEIFIVNQEEQIHKMMINSIEDVFTLKAPINLQKSLKQERKRIMKSKSENDFQLQQQMYQNVYSNITSFYNVQEFKKQINKNNQNNNNLNNNQNNNFQNQNQNQNNDDKNLIQDQEQFQKMKMKELKKSKKLNQDLNKYMKQLENCENNYQKDLNFDDSKSNTISDIQEQSFSSQFLTLTEVFQDASFNPKGKLKKYHKRNMENFLNDEDFSLKDQEDNTLFSKRSF